MYLNYNIQIITARPTVGRQYSCSRKFPRSQRTQDRPPRERRKRPRIQLRIESNASRPPPAPRQFETVFPVPRVHRPTHKSESRLFSNGAERTPRRARRSPRAGLEFEPRSRRRRNAPARVYAVQRGTQRRRAKSNTLESATTVEFFVDAAFLAPVFLLLIRTIISYLCVTYISLSLSLSLFLSLSLPSCVSNAVLLRHNNNNTRTRAHSRFRCRLSVAPTGRSLARSSLFESCLLVFARRRDREGSSPPGSVRVQKGNASSSGFGFSRLRSRTDKERWREEGEGGSPGERRGERGRANHLESKSVGKKNKLGGSNNKEICFSSVRARAACLACFVSPFRFCFSLSPAPLFSRNEKRETRNGRSRLCCCTLRVNNPRHIPVPSETSPFSESIFFSLSLSLFGARVSR